MPPAPAEPSRRTDNLKLAILATLLTVFSIAILSHARFLNGPWYWKWPYTAAEPMRFVPPLLAAAIPLAAAIIVWRYAARPRRSRIAIIAALLLLMAHMLATQLVYGSLRHVKFGLGYTAYIVQSPSNTSYFWDALSLEYTGLTLPDALRQWPHLMRQFQMHSQEKPPGPVLFFWTILRIVKGDRPLTTPQPIDQAAITSGVTIGVLATLIVPAVYALARTLLRRDDERSRDAAFFAACVIALSPGLVLHFPMLDQVYPIITCALLIAWAQALRSRSFIWAILFGFALAAACFVVFHFLVLGAFLAAYTVMCVWRDDDIAVADRAARLRAAALFCFVAVAVVAIVYLGLYVATSYDVISVFRTALQMQKEHLRGLARPYPRTILDDLQDFALGAGWLSVAVAIFCALRGRDHSRSNWLTWLCLGELVLLAVTGLMQTETARTWCFLLPLIALPAGLELSRWRPGYRAVAIAMIWLVLCLVAMNLKFIFEPIEQKPFM